MRVDELGSVLGVWAHPEMDRTVVAPRALHGGSRCAAAGPMRTPHSGALPMFVQQDQRHVRMGGER